MTTISKERRDAIRAAASDPAQVAITSKGGLAMHILALLDALDAAEKAEPVAWTDKTGLEFLATGYGIDVSVERGTMGRDIPLYTHPAPAVREGWKPLTENVVGPVLVCRFGDEDHNWLPLTAHRVTGGKWERPASRDGLPYEPTHWQRLPTAAPEAK